MRLGCTYKNNNGSEYIVLSKGLHLKDSAHIYYRICFKVSGYTSFVRKDVLVSGCVVDKLAKTCLGIGAIGYANTRKNFKVYKLWSRLLNKCYNSKTKDYHFYGNRGVTVCDRWHRFDYFLDDIKGMRGYKEYIESDDRICLDKDILSKGVKVYSPSTVKFITDYENQQQRTKEYSNRNKRYAIFPDGHVEFIINLSKFCKEHDLHRQNVTLCLAGKQEATKGYKFYRE